MKAQSKKSTKSQLQEFAAGWPKGSAVPFRSLVVFERSEKDARCRHLAYNPSGIGGSFRHMAFDNRRGGKRQLQDLNLQVQGRQISNLLQYRVMRNWRKEANADARRFAIYWLSGLRSGLGSPSNARQHLRVAALPR